MILILWHFLIFLFFYQKAERIQIGYFKKGIVPVFEKPILVDFMNAQYAVRFSVIRRKVRIIFQGFVLHIGCIVLVHDDIIEQVALIAFGCYEFPLPRFLFASGKQKKRNAKNQNYPWAQNAR